MRTRYLLAVVAMAALTSVAFMRADTAPKALSADDMNEIQQLYARYAWAIDGGDAETFASTFTDDGAFNAMVGRDTLVKFATTFHAGIGSHLRHWNSNLVVQPSPTGASGQVYLMLVDFAPSPATIVRVGSYTDELAKTAKGWRFKKRATSYPIAPAKP